MPENSSTDILNTKLIIMLAFIFLPNWSHGMEYPIRSPVDRFEVRLTEIEQYLMETMKKKDISVQIDYISHSGIRDALTELQNLFWLYSKKYKQLKQYREITKELEDHISHLKDYERFSSYAKHSNSDTKKKYRNQLEKEATAYKDFLRNSGWLNPGLPLIQKIRTDLKNINWHSLKKDRKLLLKRVENKIDKMHSKKYDFNLVEDGWHELRRDVRRFEYLNDAMDNLVVPSSEISCPLTGTTANGANHNPIKDSYTCYVSGCLLNKLSDISDALGDLKSAGARLEASGKKITGQMTRQVRALYADLMGSNVYTHLVKQLKNCRN